MVRKIKAKLVLQLRNQGLSGRAIASAQGMARNSVQAVIDAADQFKVGWNDVAEMSEGEVYSALFSGRGGPGSATRPAADIEGVVVPVE